MENAQLSPQGWREFLGHLTWHASEVAYLAKFDVEPPHKHVIVMRAEGAMQEHTMDQLLQHNAVRVHCSSLEATGVANGLK